MPDSKSPISEEDILFIGIPGVENNLTLNTEWPVEPGTVLPGEGFERAPRVKPAQELTEYKIIIADPDDLGHIKNPSHAFERRRGQLRDFLTKGGLLVCILRKADWVKNFQSSENVMNYDFIVQGWHNFTEPRGAVIKKFDITNEGRMSSFSEILKVIPQVTVYIDKVNVFWGMRAKPDFSPVKIKPLAVSTSEKPIAFEAVSMKKTGEDAVELQRKGISITPTRRTIGRDVYEEMQGKIVFLPDYVLNDVNRLVECAKQELIQMGTAGFVPAEWTNNYRFQDFDKYTSEIEELKTKLAGIRVDIEQKETEFSELKRTRDILLNGQGISVLQYKVKEVFNELGISFEDGPEGRDDLVLKDENDKTILVCEVKGVGKSASEADVTQLNKWCDRVFEEEGHLPKGLLIVNAWREKDPKDRSEDAFPDQMLKYCNAKKFCLMTTVQLYNIWCAFKRSELKGGQELLDMIMKTVGVFSGYDDPNENRISE